MTNNEEFEKILENIDENGPEPQEEPQRQYYFMKKARAILKQKAEELGRPLTACTVTFGCQMNARDSEKLIGILEKIGYVMTEDEHADFVIYNTCTVRENANQRVYGRLGALNSMKKKNQSVLSLTALFVALMALWRATGASWLLLLVVVVTIADVLVFLRK